MEMPPLGGGFLPPSHPSTAQGNGAAAPTGPKLLPGNSSEQLQASCRGKADLGKADLGKADLGKAGPLEDKALPPNQAQDYHFRLQNQRDLS